MRHSHSKAFLKPTVLTFISTFFVDTTVKVTPIVNELQSDCPPEESLQRDMEKRKQILSLDDTWKQQHLAKGTLVSVSEKVGFVTGDLRQVT